VTVKAVEVVLTDPDEGPERSKFAALPVVFVKLLIVKVPLLVNVQISFPPLWVGVPPHVALTEPVV
jgi:hypothetical protein